MEQRSSHDPLTGVANRRLFETRLASALAEGRRFAHPVSLLAIDIDHFKALNDRCGHPVGDAVLVEVARVLARGVREVDTVARVGGEEFLVVLAGADEAQAAKVGDQLRRAVAAITVPGTREQPMGHLSISVGVARARDGEAPRELVARADAALYDAKRRGRDRVSTRPPPASD